MSVNGQIATSETIDELVLGLLHEPKTASHLVRLIPSSFVVEHRADRCVDRALQRLRKAGCISYTRSGRLVFWLRRDREAVTR